MSFLFSSITAEKGLTTFVFSCLTHIWQRARRTVAEEPPACRQCADKNYCHPERNDRDFSSLRRFFVNTTIQIKLLLYGVDNAILQVIKNQQEAHAQR
jgi:hypothetical protein